MNTLFSNAMWQNSTFTKGVLGTRKFGSKKSKGRPKAESKDSFWSQSFFDQHTLQIKSKIPAAVILQKFDNEDFNPHIFLCMCEICAKIKKKLKCEHKFCLNCSMTKLRGKLKWSLNALHVKISKTDSVPVSLFLNLYQKQIQI